MVKKLFQSEYSPNDNLLFLCGRTRVGEEDKERVRDILGSNPDWDYIIKRAQREKLSPLLYKSLKEFNDTKGSIPLDAIARLEEQYLSNLSRNTVHLYELDKILRAFSGEKISVMVLKGAALLETMYKDIALRPAADIDILIRKKDLSRVNNILNSLGYSPSAEYEDAIKITSPSSINALIYIKNQRNTFPVHLHWHLINTTWPLDSLVDKIDMERIWSCAQVVKIGGIDVLTLSPEHLLIYLSQHSLNHCFDRLILLSDILETLKYYKDRLDWNLVAAEAERFNLSLVLYYSLTFTSNLFGFKTPEFERLKPDRVHLADKIFYFLLRRGVRSYVLSYLIFFSLEKGFRSKLRFAGRTIVPPNYIMAHNFTIPSSKIRFSHYFKRAMNHLLN